MYRNTYSEINLDYLKYNIETILKEYDSYKYYIGVVKSDCYSHSDNIVKYMIESGINYLAVSSLEEALKIRNKNIKLPILCLQPITLEYIEECIKNNITITVCDYLYFCKLIRLDINGTLKIHLKIDSGLNRLGIKSSEDVKMITEKLNVRSDLILEGIYTQFSTNNNIEKQIKKFKEITSLINLKKIPIIHLNKSGSLINNDKIPFANGVRLGTLMYGYDPNLQYKNSLKNKFIKKDFNKKSKYKPIFSLYSEVIQIKSVQKGETVGYNNEYKAKKNEIIGIIPIGYSDGYLRTNKNSFVVINNIRYKVIGNISMGMTAILIDDSINLYDKVVLIGNNITLYEVAYHNKTVINEILCLIGTSVPRVLIKNNKIVDIIER